MTKPFATLALLIIALSGFAIAQAPQPTFHDELLDHFQGPWVLQGTVSGKPAVHDISSAWVLEHQYLRFHEVSREKNDEGNPTYEATVFIGWDPATSRYFAIWLDIWGGFSKATVGYAPRAKDEIRFLFSDDKSTFHTTFLYNSKADTWEWQMDNEQDGKLVPFLRAKLTRPPQP